MAKSEAILNSSIDKQEEGICCYFPFSRRHGELSPLKGRTRFFWWNRQAQAQARIDWKQMTDLPVYSTYDAIEKVGWYAIGCKDEDALCQTQSID